MTQSRKLLLAFVLAFAATAAAAEEPTIYDRVAAKLGAEPQLAAKVGAPSDEIKSLSWMIGTWDIAAVVSGGKAVQAPDKGTSVISYAIGGTWIEARDTYPSGTQDVGYLTYNVVTKT